ncbi:MAG: ABC transporter permease subunit [Myxococcota bacterium]
MLRSALSRLVQALLTLMVLSVVLFRLLSAMPGNPVELLITSNPGISPEDVARLKRLRGLDQPWHVQYVRWLWGYHDGKLAPQYTGPRRLLVEAGQGAELDLAAHLKDPDDGRTPALRVVGDGAELVGTRLRMTSTTPGVRDVYVVATDADGLQTPIHLEVELRNREPTERLRFAELGVKFVTAEEPFAVDLRAALPGAPAGTVFRVVEGPGTVEDGVYRAAWEGPGQSAIVVEAKAPDGRSALGVFAVDHGPVPDPKAFQKGFLLGNLGFSNTYKRPVGEILQGRVANTLRLMLPALLLSLLLAIPIGVIAASRQYSRLDHVVSILAFVGVSIPVFWLGIMMIILFSVVLGWFPAGGMGTPGVDDAMDQLRHTVLPVLVLAAAYVGRWVRYVRGAMLEVIHQDYIRTARAKGLPEHVVIWKHALRNALIPVVTVLALSLPSLFSGAVLTETVFSWPGVGRLIYESVLNSDYYVAMVAFLVAATLVMVGNVLADVLYLAVDPRIRTRA